MNNAQQDSVLVFLTGEWPSPSFDEAQATVWRHHLAELDLEPTMRAIMALVRAEGRPFRPNPSEVLAVIRSQRAHARSVDRWALPAAVDTGTAEERAAARARCWAALGRPAQRPGEVPPVVTPHPAGSVAVSEPTGPDPGNPSPPVTPPTERSNP